MRRGRRLLLVLLAPALLVTLDLALSRTLLADGSLGWRPLPPFGATTNASQRRWLERQRARLDGREPRRGIGAFDGELGWTVRPATRAGPYSINSRGWRGPREYADPPPEGVVRVATFGDSFTFCDDVGDADTWQAILEGLRGDLEVANLGVGGYGTDQALLRFRREGAAVGADVCLLGIFLENIGRNVNRWRPLWHPTGPSPVAKPRFVLEGGLLELVAHPFASRRELVEAIEAGTVPALLADHEHWPARYAPRWLEWSSLARLFGGWRAFRERDLERIWRDEDGEPFRVTLALLARFHREALDAGAAEAAVLVFGGRPEVEAMASAAPPADPYWGGLLLALEDRGVPAVDLIDPLAAALRARGDDPQDPLFGPGSHLARAGNAVVAAAVLDWLAPRIGKGGAR